MIIIELKQITSHPFAIMETEGHDDGPQVHTISQCRFASEAEAAIAYRAYSLGRR